MTRQGYFVKRQKSEKDSGEPSSDPGVDNGQQDTQSTVDIKQPLFEYPALPRLEIWIYFIILVCTILYAWSRVFVASQQHDWHNRKGFGRFEIAEWPILTTFDISIDYRKDISNYEWRVWIPFAQRLLPWLMGHTVIFNLSNIMPSALWWWAVLAYWITAHCYIAGVMITFISVVQAGAVFAIAKITNSKFLTWLAGVYLLYASVHNPFLLSTLEDQVGGRVDIFIALSTYSYKMLQYLSFATEMLRNKPDNSKKNKPMNNIYFSKWQLLNMFWYSFYLPYSWFIIIIYKRFPQILEERLTRPRVYKEIFFFGLRILFWFILCEVLLRFFYFEALMRDPEFLRQTSKDTLVSIGYAVGQFFHLKYVIMFGLPAFFARLDNMRPLDGPVCITRVALYSKIWRQFDRGLYEFFKEYIFLPICRPTFSIWRKLLALSLCYSFVLIWHGTTHKYIVWIILNVIEILIEYIAKGVYSIPSIKSWRETNISDRNFRRILAWLQIITFAFGLYSNFYFLGSSQSGYIFVKRIFWEEHMRLRWPFWLLVGLGYCYCHVCMEVDRWRSKSKHAKSD